MRITVRELKSGLSRVLARAQGGEVIEVTSHNRPIARIIGIPRQGDAGLGALMASGAAAWDGGKPVFEPPLDLAPTGPSVSQMVLEGRE